MSEMTAMTDRNSNCRPTISPSVFPSHLSLTKATPWSIEAGGAGRLDRALIRDMSWGNTRGDETGDQGYEEQEDDNFAIAIRVDFNQKNLLRIRTNHVELRKQKQSLPLQMMR